LFQDGENGLNVLAFNGRRFQMHRNHDFRTHLPNHIRRQVVQQSAVHVNGLSLMNGREGAWDDIVARIAPASDPSLKTCDFRLTKSVATQRNGTASASNDVTSPYGKVTRSITVRSGARG